MAGYQPPYSITPQILNLVVDVGELLGRWAAHAEQSSVLLRKENRIRTIQASLAIEHNSLSMQQVTAIMGGCARPSAQWQRRCVSRQPAYSYGAARRAACPSDV